MFTDPQTITVSASAREYNASWDSELAKEIAKGSTSVKKCNITNGNSLLRFSHSEAKGVERHMTGVRDKIFNSETGLEDHQVGVHVVITCPSDKPAAASEAVALASGFLSYLAADSGAVLASVVAGNL